MKHRKSGWTCLDCAQSTRVLGEYYMVHNHVWQAANPPPIGMLCLGCLETRLGRPLTTEDFTDAPLNQDPRIRRSARLLALLGPIVWSTECWAARKPERSKPAKEVKDRWQCQEPGCARSVPYTDWTVCEHHVRAHR